MAAYPCSAGAGLPSVAAVAVSLGGEGVTVTSPEDLEDAILAIEARKGPGQRHAKRRQKVIPRSSEAALTEGRQRELEKVELSITAARRFLSKCAASPDELGEPLRFTTNVG